MDLQSTLGLLAVFVLVLANGFFVATEFAIVAVRRSRLEQLVLDGYASAKAAKDVVNHLDEYIAATQFGITLASLALGWIGEPALAHLMEPALARLLDTSAPAAAHAVALAIAFTTITALHIIMGELAPKGLALQKPESTSLWVARPIQAFHAIFKWPITALNALGNSTLKLFGIQGTTGHELVHSVEELRLLVTGMQEAGVVDATEARIAQRAFAFGDLTAGSLMTPRTEIEGVPVTATLDELLEMAETSPFGRLAVYDGSIDNIVGFLYVRELFKYRHAAPSMFKVRSIVRAPLTVPETRYAADLLEDMRHHRCHIAVVVDEYGGTAGIVALRDLLEALVGRIEDAWDATTASTGQATGETQTLDGLMRVEEFEEVAGVRLTDEERQGIETLGGLVASVAGRFPEVGEEIAIGPRRLRVEERDGFRIARVRLLPPEPR
jgi:putative hemolysin